MQPSHFDVLIIGAGISGIGAGYHLQTKCPGKTYEILEARDALGGTWDLFRYPGVRSDSDMHTLGYAFRPWDNPQSIADGPSILSYLKETAQAYGIERRIRYGHSVENVAWSSDRAQWTVDARRTDSGEAVRLTCRFLLVCAGYYDYAQGYTPDFPGRDRYRGAVVHPQRWSADVVYEGKRVVVIGSGATAVTLVPELAKKAAHVTMLQRSPTYVVSAPGRDPLADWLRRRFSERTSYAVTRWKNVALTMAFYAYCRQSPERAKQILVGQVRRQVGGALDVSTHFTPSYKPWDQRVCLVPDGDLFEAIRSGRASVETDHIASFEETGIRLRSGKLLEADLVVTATGLRLKVLGGLVIEVDGQVVDLSKTMTYKGMMCSGVPNLTFAIGYTNASWTLKCDLTNEYACRLINYMEKRGYTQCCPRKDPAVKEELMINFTSGYVRRAIDQFPRQGTVAPWKLYQNYALDRILLRHASVVDRAMEFR
ncbi:MAG TPA: NAD(P)/FAD-dependent oxidoreductase [Polyangiaceae bacterium]|nr:NAD(P)/FAD-dependent oxidoreductase [Polyangiaceae bacterium]